MQLSKRHRKPIRRLLAKQKINYLTLSDLNQDVKKLLSEIPSVDLIVGIPRAGMIPATLIAMYLHKPLTDVDGFCEKRLYSKVGDSFQFKDCKTALIVDDSVFTGRNLRPTKKRIEEAKGNIRVYYAALYVTEDSQRLVDYFVDIVPWPRIFEWNIGKHLKLQVACIDIDGVLCRNPTKEEIHDEAKYRDFLINVRPWLIPKHTIKQIVTGRLEKWRPETEAWLKQHGIKYGELVMQPEKGDHAEFKKEVYKESSCSLFIESNPKEAMKIAEIGKQVIVPGQRAVRDKLNILLHIMGINLPGGASISCCEIAGALAKRGHNVKITGHDKLRWEYAELMSNEPVSKLYQEADIILVHWFKSQEAIKLTRKILRPRVHYICDVDSVERLKIRDAALLIFNSYWLMEDTDWQGEQMVVHPPVYPEKFATTPGDGILIVSAIKSKGIDLFLEVARRMPDRKFVIALGRTNKLPDITQNVEIITHCPDARDIYAKARLVLMPSRTQDDYSLKYQMPFKWQEGYGRVAIEAACSGIPTIGSRESRGLRECLGEGGMFAGQDKVEEWIELIEKLDGPEFYKEKSEYALRLVQERHPDKYIDELERRLLAIYNRVQE